MRGQGRRYREEGGGRQGKENLSRNWSPAPAISDEPLGLNPPWRHRALVSGDQDAYPALIEKAAVLVEHLARNHPLSDGNKRAAFLAAWLFMEVNGQPFSGEEPDTDVPMVERIAAGEATPNEIVARLEKRTRSI